MTVHVRATSLNEFLTALGTVNADIVTAGQRGGLLLKTTYPQIAERAHALARSCLGLRTLKTIAENPERPWLPIYVVSVKGFSR